MFYPLIILLTTIMVIRSFMSVFTTPSQSPVTSAILFVLSVVAIGRLLLKIIILGVAEVRQRKRGGLQILPPLHYQKKSEVLMKEHPRRRFVLIGMPVVSLLVIASFLFGQYTSNHTLWLPFIAQQQQVSCTAPQAPLPILPNDIPNASFKDFTSLHYPSGWQTEVTGHNDAQFEALSGYQGKNAVSVTIKN